MGTPRPASRRTHAEHYGNGVQPRRQLCHQRRRGRRSEYNVSYVPGTLTVIPGVPASSAPQRRGRRPAALEVTINRTDLSYYDVYSGPRRQPFHRQFERADRGHEPWGQVGPVNVTLVTADGVSIRRPIGSATSPAVSGIDTSSAACGAPPWKTSPASNLAIGDRLFSALPSRRLSHDRPSQIMALSPAGSGHRQRDCRHRRRLVAPCRPSSSPIWRLR